MTISDKTRVPLGVAIGILMAILPGAVVYGQSRADMQTLGGRLEKVEKRLDAADAGNNQTKQDVAVIREQMGSMKDVLLEMRQDLKDVKAGRR